MILAQLIPARELARLSEVQLDILESAIGNELLKDDNLIKRLSPLVEEVASIKARGQK